LLIKSGLKKDGEETKEDSDKPKLSMMSNINSRFLKIEKELNP